MQVLTLVLDLDIGEKVLVLLSVPKLLVLLSILGIDMVLVLIVLDSEAPATVSTFLKSNWTCCPLLTARS